MALFFTVRDQVFNVKVFGLKPSTYHTCYFERNKVVSSKIKPSNGKLGDPIFTDENGSATFDFYYESGLGDQATDINSAQKQAANIGGKKELILTNSTLESLPLDYEETASSVFNGSIDISVYISPESEWTQPVVAAPAVYYDDNEWWDPFDWF